MTPLEKVDAVMPDQDCACAHFDRCECANMRLQRSGGARSGDEWDPCDCKCHDDYDDEMDEEDGGYHDAAR